MRELYLIRHGESLANLERRFDATPPGAPLSARGEEQAQRCAQWLASRGVSPSVVYASPFRRTVETATPFAAQSSARLVTHEALREVGVGAWDGIRSQALREDESYLRWRDQPEIAPPGGESLEEVWLRLQACLRDLCAQAPPGEALVLFTHQHPLRAALWHLGALRDEGGGLVPVPNTAILHLQGDLDALHIVGLDRSIDAATGGAQRAAI